MDPQNIFWKIQRGELPIPPAGTTLGIVIKEVDPEQGTIHIDFDAKPEFVNPVGVIQGGFLAAMLDDTLGPALVATLDVGEFAPTLELKVQFIAPAKVGAISGVGKVVSRGGKIAFLEGELRQDGKLVAKATATALIRKQA
jgi:uncharacterized protein (TIGR00369 family)